MSSKKPVSKYRKKIDSLYEENEYYSQLEGVTRAGSVSIGSATGGIIELTLRSNRTSLHYLMRPVEAIELMEQLAAASGVEIAKRPKQDFTAWRSWELDTPNGSDWKGCAPWQMTDKNRRELKKFEEKKFGVLPESTQTDKPKLQASSKRKKKVEEQTEE